MKKKLSLIIFVSFMMGLCLLGANNYVEADESRVAHIEDILKKITNNDNLDFDLKTDYRAFYEFQGPISIGKKIITKSAPASTRWAYKDLCGAALQVPEGTLFDMKGKRTSLGSQHSENRNLYFVKCIQK